MDLTNTPQVQDSNITTLDKPHPVAKTTMQVDKATHDRLADRKLHRFEPITECLARVLNKLDRLEKKENEEDLATLQPDKYKEVHVGDVLNMSNITTS